MKPFRLILRIHRMLGTVLSILFLMWFLSGMVMMYHSYPSLSNEARIAHAEQIESCDTLVHSQPTPPLSALSLQQVAGRPVFTMTDSLGETLVDALTGQPVSRFSSAELQHIANRWQSPHVYANQATLIDTLNAIDVWLIGVMPFKEYPIYHYDLNDTVGSELYLSSRTGRPLQLTDTKSRFWAWVGAIPHWIYITKLRATGRQPWTNTVLWISGFGIAMTLSGLIIGLRSVCLAHRRIVRKKGISPYAKPLLRWHHLAGLCFGLFVLTWIFSGFMSLADAPQLIWPTHEKHSARDVYADSLQLNRFTLDINHVLATDDVRRVEWLQMGTHCFYHVWTATDEYLVNATDSFPRRTTLTSRLCESIIGGKAEIIDHYDNYYISQKRQLPLPVCRVKVDDADQSTYYINPKTGDCRYYNSNRRAGKWMYTGLHALNIPFFVEHPTLRKSILWALLLGGTAVSVTGLLLSIRYVRRLLHRQKAK